jgi:hypothetical protein
MTRKHFKALAESLANTRPGYATKEYDLWRRTMLGIADVCAESNHRFNVHKFTEACHG